MASVADIVKEGLQEHGNKSVEGLEDSLKKRLVAAGLEAPLRVVELDRKTRINPDCNNYGNIEATIQYQVEHGDGTVSPPWWTDWKCL